MYYPKSQIIENLKANPGDGLTNPDNGQEYEGPYYKTSRSGVAKTNSLYNNSSYGLGGTNFGLSPAPGRLCVSHSSGIRWSRIN